MKSLKTIVTYLLKGQFPASRSDTAKGSSKSFSYKKHIRIMDVDNFDAKTDRSELK
jgi:hypothetical protein